MLLLERMGWHSAWRMIRPDETGDETDVCTLSPMRLCAEKGCHQNGGRSCVRDLPWEFGIMEQELGCEAEL